MSVSPGDHGWPGRLLAVALAIFGVLLLGLGVAEDTVPAALRPAAAGWTGEGSARAVRLVGGLVMAALAWGILGFRRWAWWGTVAVALVLAWPALDAALELLRGGAPPPGSLLDVVVVAALPYLWVRRRDYGVGTTRHAAPRGP